MSNPGKQPAPSRANLTLLSSTATPDVSIDPLASVHADAVLGEGCSIGPYAVIGADVTLGANCVVQPHGVVTGPTVMGANNVVFPFACVGGAPQDLRHRGEATMLRIGDGNTFREHVTISRGTVHGGGETIIGNDNLFMAYCHIAHDCILGNRIVMANGATLAGHVTVQDYAVFGGMVAVASFVRIGESAMLAAGAMLEKDVPPFSMVAGNRASLRGVNRVGIARRKFSAAAQLEIKRVIRMLKKKSEPLAILHQEFQKMTMQTPEGARLQAFLAQLPRGVTR